MGSINDSAQSIATHLKVNMTTLESDFCGCVYDCPESNKFAPQHVGDLTRDQLQSMRLTGLPIRASHGKFAGNEDIGVITDEWQDQRGSKHISFRIHKGMDAYREGIKQNWYSHLSLGHEVRADGVVPVEVSICHLGARANTTIARTTPHEYKLFLAHRDTNPEKMDAPQTTMDTTPVNAPAPSAMETSADAVAEPVAPSEQVPTQGSAAPMDETPEEKALRVIGQLGSDQQEAIASAWTITSQKLQETQELLEKAEKAQAEFKTENTMLRKASEETAKQLVASLKEAYDAHGTEMPTRYQQEISQQVNANPTLAQALSHAIPVCASAMSRKRARTEEPSSFSELQGFLRAHVRERGHSSFKGDYEAATQAVKVEASAKANTAAQAPVPVPVGPGSKMIANLRAALRR